MHITRQNSNIDDRIVAVVTDFDESNRDTLALQPSNSARILILNEERAYTVEDFGVIAIEPLTLVLA